MKLHSVQTLGGWEHKSALWQKRKVAYHHKVLYTAAERRKDSGAAYRLEAHPYQSESYVLTRGIGLGIAKERGNGIHRQTFKRIGADILNQEVDVREVALLGKSRYLLYVVGLEQQTRQSLQCAAALSQQEYLRLYRCLRCA